MNEAVTVDKMGSAGQVTGSIRASVRLAWDLAVRDLRTRYARSLLGTLWFVLNPLLLVGVYWTVFGYILHLSWVDPTQAKPVGYIVPFIPALLVYLTLSDVINSSVSLYQNKRNYVLKSPFPIWVLWLANLIRSGAQALGLFTTMIVIAAVSGTLTFTGVLWLLPALALSIAFCAALSLLLAALGPFIPDLTDAFRLLLRVLFYAAPVTYPLSIVPEKLRLIIELNPLTELLTPVRNAVAFGIGPEPVPFIATVGATLALGGVAYWAHSRLKGAIADVL